MESSIPSSIHPRRAWRLLIRPRATALVLAFALQPGCSSPRDPQAVFDHARNTLRKGENAAAAAEAERGYGRFHSEPEWAWKFTILRATALQRADKNDEMLKLLASDPAPPPSPEWEVKKHMLKGKAYTSLHSFAEAAQEFDQADRLCAGADFSGCTDAVAARGAMEMQQGHFAQAQTLFARVLPKARASTNRFWEASALLDMSWSADEQTHFDEALDWSNAALQISTAQGFAGISQIALGNMGWAYYKLGDPEKAEAIFTQARDQAEKLGDTSAQSTWLQALGYIHLDARRFDAAEKSFKRALDLARHTNKTDLIDSLTALAFVSEQTGKLDDAKRYAEETLAKAQEDKNGREQVYPQLVLARLAARRHDTATAENTLREVAQSADCPVFLKWEAERSLARLYEDNNRFDSADSEYRTALNTFEKARYEVRHEDSRLAFLTNAARIYDDYIHFLIARGKTIEALQAADFSRARTLMEGLGLLSPGTSFAPEPINAQQIARHAGGTILFYWLGEEESYLWAVAPQQVGLFHLPPAAEIRARVERYRAAIIDQQEFSQTANDDGATLYRILIAPAKDFLPKVPAGNQTDNLAKNRKVFVIPDGSLNSLNFETLLVPGTTAEKKQHYWIEDVTLSSASSLRILQAFRAPSRSSAGNLLLFGDAIAPNEDFPQLPKAAIEMESIKKHFSPRQQQVFSRAQASPPAYLASNPERFSYIHFVAHGTASRLSPLDSAIVLSRANAEEDSFKLYARDIIQHSLRANLVTVSTCRSAGARAYSGEGLVGLSWAFVRAGAHHVIGALWDVSDASTPQLMDELYGELKKGKTPEAALRDAKLALLRSSASFRKPFYWAPFQLYTGY
jgi:CHAT domain-containing protein/Tfp pilus assembly protein PilF